jgi:DNA helicase II / ATP-dependent DNA helicase PcrA
MSAVVAEAPTSTAWTPEQNAVFETIRGVPSHVNVQAVAGAGKSTTAVQIARVASVGRIGFVAFNKHIADSLAPKLGGTATACTLHSLGNRALSRAFPVAQLDKDKATRLLAVVWPEGTYTGKGGTRLRPSGKAVIELARMAKLKLLATDVGPSVWERLADEAGIEIPRPHTAEELGEHAAELMVAMKERTATYDFDDMLWLPVTLGLPVQQFDLLLVDEAQDLSPLQRELAMSACQGGRMVVIADTRQSIYAFTGADPDSVPTMCRHLGATDRGCLDRPLTVTFRCPTSHVALAQREVPHIRARDGAPEGIVREADEDTLVAEVKPGDLVIARRNAPLVTLTLRLLAAGVPAQMMGRDIGAGLLSLVDQLRNNDIHTLIDSLHDWRQNQTDSLERKGADESAFLAVEDRFSCLLELACRQPTVQALREFVRQLGADQPDTAKVSLSSIHRAKGLEADRVWIADTECLPMFLTCRKCRGTGVSGRGECEACRGRGTRSTRIQQQQERNLLYVALTRAKHELVFVGGKPAVLRDTF